MLVRLLITLYPEQGIILLSTDSKKNKKIKDLSLTRVYLYYCFSFYLNKISVTRCKFIKTT